MKSKNTKSRIPWQEPSETAADFVVISKLTLAVLFCSPILGDALAFRTAYGWADAVVTRVIPDDRLGQVSPEVSPKSASKHRSPEKETRKTGEKTRKSERLVERR